MKLRDCVVVVLATTLMGAAPPAARQPVEPTSPWGKLKAGALRLLPGGTDEAQSPARAQPANARSAQPPMRRDEHVQPATAVQAEPRRRGLFGQKRRPRRTLSEYMAWEKP